MRKGIYLALITATISGFSIFFSKISVSVSDPIVFTTLKNGLVAIVLSFLLLGLGLFEKLKKLSRKDWLKLILIGIIGGSFPFALFFTGLTMTPAVNAAIIHKTLYLWVGFLAIIFLKEKLTLFQMLGYVLILWGNLWVGGFEKFSFNRGELMIFAATALWAIENVIAKQALKKLPSEIVAWARMLIGSLILLGIVVWQGKGSFLFNLNQAQVLTTLISSLFLIGYVLTWYKALKYAPATVVSSVLVFSTVITNALSSIFITHKFPQPQILSSLFLVSGVVLISFFKFEFAKLNLFNKIKRTFS